MRLVALLFLLWGLPLPALASGLAIDTPGVHRLTEDVTGAEGAVVRIRTDDVALDLNGHTIRCAPADPATAGSHGVHAPQRRNIRVYNGRITGCMFGINMTGAEDVSVVDGDLSGNTFIGVQLRGARGAQVRASTFADIGGYALAGYAVGINGVGSDAVIDGNTFVDIVRQPGFDGVGEGVAILISSGSRNVTVRRNWIENLASPHEIAIWVAADTADVEIVRNVISGYAMPIRGANGTAVGNSILLQEPIEPSIAIQLNAGTARDNLVVGFQAPFGDMIVDGGGNVIVGP